MWNGDHFHAQLASVAYIDKWGGMDGTLMRNVVMLTVIFKYNTVNPNPNSRI